MTTIATSFLPPELPTPTPSPLAPPAQAMGLQSKCGANLGSPAGCCNAECHTALGEPETSALVWAAAGQKVYYDVTDVYSGPLFARENEVVLTPFAAWRHLSPALVVNQFSTSLRCLWKCAPQWDPSLLVFSLPSPSCRTG